MINTSIHVHSRKCFRTKKAQKPNPMGVTYLYGLYKGVPLGPDPFHDC